MSFPYAYCVELQEVIDIFEANAYYFSQVEPRKGYEFLCPSDACRELEKPSKISGVSYHKNPSVDRFVQRMHFRAVSGYAHDANCRWVDFHEALEEFDKEANRAKWSNLKTSELVSIFKPVRNDEKLVQRIDAAKITAIGALPTKRARVDGYKAFLKENPNRTSRLHEVVDCYERLSVSERERAKLKIGGLDERTYYENFAPVRYCTPQAYYPRIYFGKANVRKYKTGYSIQFKDSAKQADEQRLNVFTFIHVELINTFRGRDAVLATFNCASEQTGNVLTCYVFGDVQQSETKSRKPCINVVPSSLHSLAITLTDDA